MEVNNCVPRMEVDAESIRRQTRDFEHQIKTGAESARPLAILQQAVRTVLAETEDGGDECEAMWLLRYAIPRLTYAFLRRYVHYPNGPFKSQVLAVLQFITQLCAHKIDQDIPEVFDLLSRLFSFAHYSRSGVIARLERTSLQRRQRQREGPDHDNSDMEPTVPGGSLASLSDLESEASIDEGAELDMEDDIVGDDMGNMYDTLAKTVDYSSKVRSAAHSSHFADSGRPQLDGLGSEGADMGMKDTARAIPNEIGTSSSGGNKLRETELHRDRLSDSLVGRAVSDDREAEDEPYVSYPVDHITRSNEELSQSFKAFFSIINAFGREGGFDRILDRLREIDGRRCSASLAKSLLYAPNKIGWLMSMSSRAPDIPVSVQRMGRATGKLAEFALAARNATFQLLMNMTDKELKAQDKQEVKDVFTLAIQMRSRAHMVSESCSNVRSIQQIQEEYEAEEFQLQFAIKKMKSSYLELRLLGLGELKRKISSAHADRCSPKNRRATGKPGSEICPSDVASGSRCGCKRMVLSRGEAGSENLSAYARDEHFTCEEGLTADGLSKWLIKNRIVDLLFDHSRLHAEVIKRSGEVLAFLSSCEVLLSTHIDTIWSATKHTHESIVHAVYSIAVDLPKCLSQALTERLWSHIEAIPLDSYDKQTVLLVGSFTMAAMSVRSLIGAYPMRETIACGDGSGNQGWFGMGILWKIVQRRKEENINNTVYDSAYERLSEYLQRREFASRREPMIRKCIENIRYHRAMPQSLALLKTLIGTYSQSSKPGSSRTRDDIGSVITWLERDHHLLDLVVTDFVKYYTDIFAVHEGSNSSNHADPQNALDGGFWSHTHHVTERLEFLNFYITNMAHVGQPGLSAQHIDSIWKYTIEKKVSESESELAFSWLEKLSHLFASVGGGSLLNHVFESKLRAMDLINMTLAGGSCFKTYFHLVNWRDGRFSTVDFDKQPLIVLSPELRGMDPLWNVAIDTVNEDVGNKVGAFIVKLYLNLDQRLAPLARRKVIEFVDICMRRSGEAVEILESNKHHSSYTQTLYAAAHRRVQRCIGLLHSFLDEFEDRISRAGGKSVERHGSSSLGRRIRIGVNVISGERFELTCHSNETLGALRCILAVRIQGEASGVRVFTAGKELKEDSKTLGELRITDRQQFLVMKRVLTKETLSMDQASLYNTPSLIHPRVLIQRVSEEFYPSRLLSRKNYFGLFFRMLELECELQEKASSVWQLLMRIPTNRAIALMLRNPKQVTNWKSVLDQDSPFRLYYSLQIVEALCDNESGRSQQYRGTRLDDRDPGQKGGSEHTWRESFVESGGLVHLLSTLKSREFLRNVHQDRRRSCLSLLLNLINRFFVEDYREVIQREEWDDAIDEAPPRLSATGRALLPEKELKELVVRMLEVSSNLAQSEEESSNKSTDRAELFGGGEGFSDLVISPVVRLVVAAVTSSPSYVRWFCECDEYSKWLKRILIGCEGAQRREAAAQSVELLVSASPESRTPLLTRLLQMMDSVCSLSVEESFKCVQFFKLSGFLLARYPETNHLEAGGVAIYQNVVDRIIRMPIREKMLVEIPDQVLIGLLELAVTLISRRDRTRSNLKEPQKVEAMKETLKFNDSLFPGTEKAAAERSQFTSDSSFGVLPQSTSQNDLRLMDEVFSNCLFGVPTASSHGPRALPKCKTHAARNAAFRVLSELSASSNEHFQKITDRLLGVHKCISVTLPAVTSAKRSSAGVQAGGELEYDNLHGNSFLAGQSFPRGQWNYSPAALNKSPCGYVGLKNLGTTCYMNSVIQQLFMIPSFREGILQAPVSESDKTEPGAILYNLQKMFGFLLLSEKKFFDTRDFCSVYRDYDNQPMNTAMQMDVDEFLNMLFDKLEKAVQGGPKEKILEDTFCGGLINQVICREVEYVSEVEEKFFVLSLEVKEKKSVQESLDFYIQGEILDGDNKYYCEPFKKQVPAVKRTCLGSLPQTLILHLKRFEFNYDTMRKIKVNDSCEFPMELDLYPYTKDALDLREKGEQDITGDQSQILYDLVGILVHIGTADSGHYYSYIQERSTSCTQHPRWFQFNDMHTEPFDPRNIPETCFGGEERISRFDPVTHKPAQFWQQKQHSAYMLFYERRDSCQSGKRQSETSKTNKDQDSWAKAISVVPKAIFDSAWRDNETFFNDKHLFELDYASFIWDLVRELVNPSRSRQFCSDSESGCQIVDQQVMRATELGIRYVFDVLCRSKEKHLLRQWNGQMQELLRMNIGGSKWMLDVVGREYARLLLFECNVPEARFLFNCLIAAAMKTLRAAEVRSESTEECLTAGVQTEEPQPDHMNTGIDEKCNHSKSAGTVDAFVDFLLSMLNESVGYGHACSQYFDLLLAFGQMGRRERAFLLSRQLIYRTCHSYLGDDSPFANFGSDGDRPRVKRSKTNESIGLANVSSMISLLALLIRSTVSVCGTLKPFPPTLLDRRPICHLDAVSRNILLNGKFWEHALRGCTDTDALAVIASHLCWEDEHFTNAIRNAAIQGLDKANYEHFEPYFAVIRSLVQTSDSLRQIRLNDTMTAYMSMLMNNSRYAQATGFGLRFLVDESETNRDVGLWLMRHVKVWLRLYILENEAQGVRKEAESLARVLAVSSSPFVSILAEAVIDLLPEALAIVKAGPKRVTVSSSANGGVSSSLSQSNFNGRVYELIVLLFILLNEEETRVNREVRSPREQMQTNPAQQSKEKVAVDVSTQFLPESGDWNGIGGRSFSQDGARSGDADRMDVVPSRQIGVDSTPQEAEYGRRRLRSRICLLLQILSAVEILQIECDSSKLAVVKLLKWLADDPDCAREMTCAQNRAEKLLSLRISPQPVHQIFIYNSDLIQAYFDLLRFVANAYPPFLQAASCHKNLDYAISNILLDHQYGSSAGSLLHFVYQCAGASQMFRIRQLDLVLQKIREQAHAISSSDVTRRNGEGSTQADASCRSSGSLRKDILPSEHDEMSEGCSGMDMVRVSMSQSPCAPQAQQLIETLLVGEPEVFSFLSRNGLELPIDMLLKSLPATRGRKGAMTRSCDADGQENTVYDGHDMLESGLIVMSDEVEDDCYTATRILHKCIKYCQGESMSRMREIASLAAACARVVICASTGPPVTADVAVLRANMYDVQKEVGTMADPAVQLRPTSRALLLQRSLFPLLGLFAYEDKSVCSFLVPRFIRDFSDVNARLARLSVTDGMTPGPGRGESRVKCSDCMVTGKNPELQPGEMSPSTSESREQLAQLALTSKSSENTKSMTRTLSSNFLDDQSGTFMDETGKHISMLSLPAYMASDSSLEAIAKILSEWIRVHGSTSRGSVRLVLRRLIPALLLRAVSLSVGDMSSLICLGCEWLDLCAEDRESELFRIFGLSVLNHGIEQAVRNDSGVQLVLRLMNDEQVVSKLDFPKLVILWSEIVREGLERNEAVSRVRVIGGLGGLVVLSKMRKVPNLLSETVRQIQPAVPEHDDVIKVRLEEVRKLCCEIKDSVGTTETESTQTC